MATMAAYGKGKKEIQSDGAIHNLRITLVAQKVDILENTCSELIRVRVIVHK